MRYAFQISILIYLSVLAVQAEDLRSGHLGFPLGKFLSVEGVRAEKGMVGTQTLIVDTVNDKKLASPITIWVDNVASLPQGTRCVLHGYESGRMIGIPDEVIAREHLEPSQAAFQFQHYFIATSVVQPQGMKKTDAGIWISKPFH